MLRVLLHVAANDCARFGGKYSNAVAVYVSFSESSSGRVLQSALLVAIISPCTECFYI